MIINKEAHYSPVASEQVMGLNYSVMTCSNLIRVFNALQDALESIDLVTKTNDLAFYLCNT